MIILELTEEEAMAAYYYMCKGRDKEFELASRFAAKKMEEFFRYHQDEGYILAEVADKLEEQLGIE